MRKLSLINAAMSSSLQKLYYGINALQDDENPKKITANSPSNTRKMPDDWLPTHYLYLLANGPAADDQQHLWIPETAKGVVTKQKADILDCTVSSASIGWSSVYSRKAHRLEGSHISNATVLDLTKGDEVSNDLLRVSLKNSAQIISLLKVSSDPEQKTFDSLALNAHRMYELDGTQENKDDYIRALQKQKDLLVLKSVQPTQRKEERSVEVDDQCDGGYSDDFLFYGHTLDDSFSNESVGTNGR